MPRVKKVRKASEEGRATTLWLRRGTVRRAEAEARKERLSLSQFAERALQKELEARSPAVAAA